MKDFVPGTDDDFDADQLRGVIAELREDSARLVEMLRAVKHIEGARPHNAESFAMHYTLQDALAKAQAINLRCGGPLSSVLYPGATPETNHN